LDILRDEKLADHAEEVGIYLQSEFRRIAHTSPIIGDVRGKGMLISVEFVKDKHKKEPNLEALAHVFEKGK
jgi:4-aminobutyrate aminotransferase-like enzyme